MNQMQSYPAQARRGSARTWLAASLLTAMTAGPAFAQWFEGPRPYMYNRPPPIVREARPLPPYAIVERLEEQGYENVGRPRFDGSVYEIEATGLSGARVRVVVDAFRGNVVERYAVSRAPRRPDFGPRDWGDEDRGWFGNNVRPPEATAPRRYSNRPGPDDDLQDFLDRPARPGERRPELDARIDVAPLPERRIETRPEQPPRPADQPSERQAARPDAATRPEPVAPGVKVDGLNPDVGRSPDAAKPAAPRNNERASRPEPNRQYEAARTEPNRPRPAKPTPPASQEGSAAVSPPAPAPAVTPPAPPAEKPAVTAEKPTEKPAAPAEPGPRSDKPIRVIQGVTPMNPEAATPKP